MLVHMLREVRESVDRAKALGMFSKEMEFPLAELLIGLGKVQTSPNLLLTQQDFSIHFIVLHFLPYLFWSHFVTFNNIILKVVQCSLSNSSLRWFPNSAQILFY